MAAIIRADKNYFDYRKTIATQSQVREKVERENEQIAESMGDTVATDSSVKKMSAEASAGRVKKILLSKQLALALMERRLHILIERNITLSKDAQYVAVDGFVAGKAGGSDRVFEVRYLPSGSAMHLFTALMPGFRYTLSTLESMTGRTPELNLVILVPDTGSLTIEEARGFESRLADELGDVQVHWIGKNELGLDGL